jgi:hypothetical protein
MVILGMVRSRHGLFLAWSVLSMVVLGMVRSRHGRCAKNIGSFYICCNQNRCGLLLQLVSVAFGQPESQVHNFVLRTGLWHKIFDLRLYLPISSIRVNARQAKFF